MSTPLENIYDIFYSSIQIDLSKNPELDIVMPDNLIDVYLQSALYDYEENFGITLTIDSALKVINEDIPQSHIKLLGKLIYKNYLERELNHALRIANQFNKRSELSVTGMPTKINALRDSLSRVDSQLNRSFTRGIMKGINKL